MWNNFLFSKLEANIHMGHLMFLLGIFASKGFTLLRSHSPISRHFLVLKGGIKTDDNITTDIAGLKEQEASLELYYRFRSSKDGFISAQLNSALDILTNALRLYGPHQLFSSFNGGKDAVIIMHLLRAVTAKYSQDCGKVHRPQFVYFAIEDEFPEVIEHINESEKMFNLKLFRYNCAISQGLAEHIATLGTGSTPAFVLGTRKSDPNSGDQQIFAPSSWNPPFMRVNPILNWEYGHVWHFLRTFNLPYCCLYDQGYTSLGKVTNTSPNPALLRKNVYSPGKKGGYSSSSTPLYWPAYMLADWTLERAGRGSATSPDSAKSLQTTDSAARPVNDTVTAGMVIIGDEILSGMTSDLNLQVASKALNSIGIPLVKVAVVLDDIDDIVDEVRRMSQKYDVVITSGGIGPTHDDVTIKAVAKALNQTIKLNDIMMEHLEKVYKLSPSRKGFFQSSEVTSEMSDDLKRLALLPENSKLLFPPSEDTNLPIKDSPRDSSRRYDERKSNQQEWPVLQCENIFVLPGIPQFFEKKMDTIARHFLAKRKVKQVRKILLDVEERSIVGLLDKLVVSHSTVKFGSYPYIEHPEFKTIITVEGFEIVSVEEAVNALVQALPSAAVLRVERVDNTKFLS